MISFWKSVLSISTRQINNNSYYKIWPLRSIAYKSSISLDKLYPNSTLKITTPSEPEGRLCSKFSGYIPLDELDISYTRSSGPGGQNVNKVNTKVNIRFHVESAKWIDNELKPKIIDKLKTKLTKDGYLIFASDLTRSQQLNLADCLEKIRTCIVNASAEAPPISEETKEKIRRRQEKAAIERLAQKRIMSQVKNDRRAPDMRNM